MRFLAVAFVPFAAMLLGCQTSPEKPLTVKPNAPLETPVSNASDAAVPKFGPLSR